jgi:Fur family transcriptional regulator, stress-responsive regulator
LGDGVPTADPLDLLRGAGLRVTQPRLAVLAALAEAPHADVEAIATATRTVLGTVSTQAVYDVLRALTEAGLARRIEPAGSPARFELRVGDNHHHVVCRLCGSIADVDCAVGERPCLTASEAHGFVIDEAEVTYWGICPDCSTRTSPTTPLGTPSEGTR